MTEVTPLQQSTPKLGRLVVVGLGLIGGSFAKGLRSKGLFREVVGVDRDAESCRLAVELGVVDRCEEDLGRACVGADVIQLAVPILAMERVLADLAKLDLGKAVLTDVGSAKGNIVRAARVAFGGMPRYLVPGHPIAGSEQSGVTAAKATLFRRHKVILTPSAETDADALALVDSLWRALGADVEHMEVEHHDEVLAATSHLPHLLAFTLVDSLAKRSENLEIFRYAAGGFRDFTRIAGSDPVMWHDIFLANREAVLRTLDVFRDDLDALREAVDTGDGHQLLGVFTRARVAREHFSKILARRAYVDAMHNNDLIYLAQPGGSLSGTIRVPGDKSISHRSIMLGSLAEGTTEVEGFLEGEDALATIQAFRDMGVVIEGPQNGRVTVHGVGLHGLKAPPGPIYLGNSGTSMRLLSGLLAAQPFDSTLTGDASLSKRPMNRVAKPLREMGAVIETGPEGRPPMTIRGGQRLTGMHYDMPMASAQVKSCLLLAGLYAAGETSVTEPAPTRDHTERMLRGFGYPVVVEGSTAKVESGHKLSATHIEVPADISSAAFFLVAASIAEGSELVLQHVGINPTRVGVIEILRLMGGDLSLENQREVGGEPVADIRVRSARLKGIDIPEDLVPLAIDEFPVLFVAAACAEGRTVLRGAEEPAGQGVGPYPGHGRRPEGPGREGRADPGWHRHRGWCVRWRRSLGARRPPYRHVLQRRFAACQRADPHPRLRQRRHLLPQLPRPVCPDRYPGRRGEQLMNGAVPMLAIDGPSGAGKGTVAGLLARRLGWNLLDSGALYRLLAFAAVNHGVDLTNEEALKVLAAHLDVQFVAADGSHGQRIILEGEEVTDVIRTEQVGAGASQVAALPAVRDALLQRQRAFREAPGLVADGRDMGTVVFPDAPLKIFLTASAEERARRRYLQLKAKGADVDQSALLEEIRERDERDSQRAVAPLKPADDAILLDSTEMSIEAVVETIIRHCERQGWDV